MGFFLDMPEGVYHAVRAFSYSGSKELAKSPAHFKAYLSKEWEIDPDREKFKAVHLLCLEEGKQDRISVVDGVWSGERKAQVLELQKKGQLVLKKAALEDAKNIAAAVKAHALAGSILSKALCEVSLFWSDEETGVYCKARIDILYLDDEDLMIGDIKNFGDISRERILSRFIHDNKYYWQMHHYSCGLMAIFNRKVTNHYWFFLEDKPPHGVKVRTCSDAMLELAAQEMNPLLPLYRECEESDTWPSYPDDPENADLPLYAWDAETKAVTV